MTGTDLVLSVPGNRAPVAVPQVHTKRVQPGLRRITIHVPEPVALYAEHHARATGHSIEQVLTELIADGLDARLVDRHPGTTHACPDGRPHQRGTINTRHCMRCRVFMP
ncbi:hypothetical protein [Amycolatopsis taiwanensis]|uniref:hypothetical protein n=1 Tax=Amycolatopsis taiwanensis TaxID=342230 RepID=UPI00047F9077|nr:hypothetical protein [Amycolatopsis taiwanensis]